MKLFFALIASFALISWLANAQETQDCPGCGADMIMPTLRLVPQEFEFRQGDGDLIINVHAKPAGNYPHIKVKDGLSAKGAYAFSDKYGNMVIVFTTGDRIFLNGFMKSVFLNVKIEFSDRETWGEDEIRDLADIGSAKNRALYGDGKGNTFDPKGFARTIVSKGGGDTILYNKGYGNLRIVEVDPEGPNEDNVLTLGPGLSAAEAKVTKSPGGDILLSFGNGDVITMTDAMTRSDTSAHGIQTIKFSDGTIWAIGDLRYQLAPSTGDMKITRDDSAGTIGASLLASGGYLQDSIDVTDPHERDSVRVKILSVSQTGEVSKNISNIDLLKMLEFSSGGADNSSLDFFWSFSGRDQSKDAFNYLRAGRSVVLDYQIAISDGQGGEIHKDVKITIAGPEEDAENDDPSFSDTQNIEKRAQLPQEAAAEFDRPVRGRSTDIYLVLDTSPSMLLPTSQAGISAMRKVTTTEYSTGCAYACHDQNAHEARGAIHDRQGDPIFLGPDGKIKAAPNLKKCEQASDLTDRYTCRERMVSESGDYADAYWAARNYRSLYGGSNVRLRIDAETDAARALMALLNRAPRRPDAPFQFQALGFGEFAPTPLSGAMTVAGKLNPAAFPDLAAMQPQWYSNNCRLASICNDDMATNFQTMLASMNSRISAPGGGSPSKPPRKLMLLVTDGMGDEPTGKRRWVGELSAEDRAQCEAIKAQGVRVGIVYLEYPVAAIAGDSWSEGVVGPHLARIEPALRRCASLVNGTPLVVKAGLGQSIPEALRALFRRAVAGPVHAR